MTRPIIISFAVLAAAIAVDQAQAAPVQPDAGPSAPAYESPVQRVLSPDPHVIVRRTKVSYAGLDLSSEAGLVALQARLEEAASSVCREAPGAHADRAERRDYAKCRSGAISDALRRARQIGRAQLAKARPPVESYAALR